MDHNYYVHKHLKNYKRYGLEKIIPNQSEDANVVKGALDEYLEAHETIRTKCYLESTNKDKPRLLDIEDFYNKIIFGKDNSGNKFDNTSAAKIITQATQNILNEKYGHRAGIVENILGVAVNEDMLEQESGYRGKIQKILKKNINNLNTKASYNKKTTYEDRYKELKMIFDKARPGTELRSLIEEEIKNKQLAADLNDLRKKLREIIKNMDDTLDVKIINKETGLEQINPSLEYFNKVIDTLGKLPYWGVKKNQLGDIGEIITSLIEYAKIDGMALVLSDINVETLEESASKALKKGMSKVETKYEGIKNYAKNFPENWTATAAEGSYIATVNKVSGGKKTSKIDISVTHLGASELKKPLEFSVKNYSSLKNDLSVLTGSPVIELLNYIDPEKYFEGHFANLIYSHKDENENNVSDLITYRTNVRKMVQETALIVGIEGYERTNKPNIFLAFGRYDQKVRAYDVTALIANLLDEKSGGSYKSQHYIPKKGVNNEYYDISNLILKEGQNPKDVFNNHKIHVSIKLDDLINSEGTNKLIKKT